VRAARSLTLAASLLCAASVGEAQRPDSSRTGVAARPADTSATLAARRDSLTPPLSPRRAFVYSLLAPGYSQTVLGRPTAAAVYLLAEAIAALMILESSASLREARRLARDTVFLGTDPQSGEPIRGASPFPRSLVRSRQAQLEDWIAVLLFNHAFAGADAFVAAHLWDVPARVQGSGTEARHLTVGAKIRW
jgi:hypothetical protein